MESEQPSSTILCYPTDSKGYSNVEVLNVNNVDSGGGVVLNDEKLLELIQLYPFLYNPRVRPFQDPDYDDWAWNRITNAFNVNYMGFLPAVYFTKDDLKRRWNKLQPIIKKMAKMLDLTAIPEPLRQIIVKISIQLEDQVTDVRVNNLSSAQQVIYDNMKMVSQLPLNRRLQLEAEMMDLILNAELESKATVKLTYTHLKTIEDEYEELLNMMNLKEIIVLKSTDTIFLNEKTDNSQEQIVTSTTSNGTSEICLGSDSSSDTKYESLNIIDFEAEMGSGSQIYKPSCQVKKEMIKTNTATQLQWVPLEDASKHVRRCIIKLKRTNMEDYIPLSRIKRQRKST
uniref:MADF domain-containing protein n=1 Tax=Bactrocera dorsalis TaxID=27457 RepID=A0A034WUK9_BACDO